MRAMRGSPRLGKAGQSILESVIYRSLGASSSQLIVGPAFGADNSILRLGRGRVLVATSDPLSYIPSLGPEASAWLSVHLLASDLTTSGFSPQFGLFDFNLPPTLSDANFAKYWRSFHKECKQLGLSIIGGHGSRGQLPDVRHGSSWRRYHTDKRSGDRSNGNLDASIPKESEESSRKQ